MTEETDEPTNEQRAAWAGTAIHAYQKATGSDDEDVLSDLLADLMHWAEKNNYDFDAALIRAHGHHDAELSDREIVIEVEGGVVQHVQNVPPGYSHRIVDLDEPAEQPGEPNWQNRLSRDTPEQGR